MSLELNGYFLFPNGDQVAFDGSFNESYQGHHVNKETVQVFRSWIEHDQERIETIRQRVDEDWNTEEDEDITVFPISKKALEQIKKHSPHSRPRKGGKLPPPKPSPPIEVETARELWDHQKEAVGVFLKKKTGILEMATGTGKTRVALEIIRKLFLQNEINSVIIVTEGTDLLDQWHETISGWQNEKICSKLPALNLFQHFDDHHQIQDFLADPANSILIISRNKPQRLQKLFIDQRLQPRKRHTLIIHDEIHGFGSPSLVTYLSESHSGFQYKLGLSATPEREYDEQGSQFIQQEVGDVIYEYPVEKAIEDGILCEFDYHPLPFYLTTNDKQRLQSIHARAAQDRKKGNPWDQRDLAIKLSHVIKTAEDKPDVLDGYLNKNSSSLKSAILFVDDIDQGDKICDVVHRFTNLYKTYYAGTESDYLQLLSKREIDCLVACARLNQGIDIKSLETIFLIATPRAKLITIQRLGRCLRSDAQNPDKRALVVDLICTSEKEEEDGKNTADEERVKWLKELSKIKNKTRNS